MNRFNDSFIKYPTDKPKYADFYWRYLGGLTPRLLLEIGVLEGGSLRAWQEIFPTSKIVGIDIDPEAKDKNPDLNIYIGDQTDTSFLDSVLLEIGTPDIVIDDGGHSRRQQVGTFTHLFPILKGGGLQNNGGIYVIEDLETSYFEAYDDGGISAIQMLRDFVDSTDWDGDPQGRKPGDIFHYIYSALVFEPNICLVKKR